MRFEAESPDESALVEAACAYGFRLLERTNQRVTVRDPLGNNVRLKPLNVLTFTSDRKRSVFVLLVSLPVLSLLPTFLLSLCVCVLCASVCVSGS